MMFKKITKIIVFIGLVAGAAGCGSGSGTEFSTVSLTVGPGYTIESDITGGNPVLVTETYTDTNTNGTWDPGEAITNDKNANGIYDAVSYYDWTSVGVKASDSAKFLFATTSNTTSPSNPSRVTVKTATLTYTAVDNDVTLASAMPSYSTTNPVVISIGQEILAGTSVEIPVEIVTSLFKSTYFAVFQSGQYYSYDVKVVFVIEENSSGKSESVTRYMRVKIGHYVD